MPPALHTPCQPASDSRASRWTDRLGEYVFSRRRDLIEHEMDGEVILYDPQSGSTCRLNATALEVWRHCDGSTTPSRIAQQQTELYDVELDTASDHVEQLIVRFAESGLLAPSPSP